MGGVFMSETARKQRGDGMLTMQLQRRLGNFQLAIDARVPLGLIVLFGPSGAGKSLTLRCLAGLLRPERGYISLDGQFLFDSTSSLNLPSQARRVGYVPQHYALFPHLTVAENIRFALPEPLQRAKGRQGRVERDRRVSELLSALQLEGLERRYPSTLSGGQQQRVALARALAAKPRLLLLDEPFNALDAAVRERLRDMLRGFQRRFAIPIVLVTHDHQEVQQLADTVVALQQGKVVQVGSVEEIFYAPRTLGVARLTGQRNIFGGHFAAPLDCQPGAPSLALRLDWLQSSDSQERVSLPQSESDEHGCCWLPLPVSALPAQSSASQTFITGCLRADAVSVQRWREVDGMPPLWAPEGAVQWVAELLEARPYKPAMRLLVRPRSTGSVMELYLSSVQWRDIDAHPGQDLLLTIAPAAVHCFAPPEE
jgi:ABC-type sulfate/molybdate transport systems ATPase subunit